MGGGVSYSKIHHKYTHALREQSQKILENVFLSALQNLGDPRGPRPANSASDGKTVTSVSLLTRSVLFLIVWRKQNKWCQLKNAVANVNHVILTRFGEVYSDVGWRPREPRDPKAAESVGAKLSASLSNTAPKKAFAGKGLANACYITVTIELMNFRGVYLMTCWSLQI